MMLIDHQRHAPRILERIGDLGRAPAEVGGHDHAAGPGGRQIDLQVMIAVEREYGDARTFGQALGR
jgi:hypothetical protein